MRRIDSPQVELQIAPLIDVCFLLLFFFMATAVPEKKDGRMDMALSRLGFTEESFPAIEEQRLKILDTGEVLWNEAHIDSAENTELPLLSEGLKRLKAVAEISKAGVSVIIEAEDKASYQRLIDVIGACQRSGATAITFSPAATAFIETK